MHGARLQGLLPEPVLTASSFTLVTREVVQAEAGARLLKIEKEDIRKNRTHLELSAYNCEIEHVNYLFLSNFGARNIGLLVSLTVKQCGFHVLSDTVQRDITVSWSSRLY